MSAIGIDFGTSRCYVSAVVDGQVVIFENELGNRATPSSVSLPARKRMVGEEAVQDAETNPKNAVFGIKRILGRRFEDPVVSNFRQRNACQLENVQGIPKIIGTDYEEKGFYPEEVASILFLSMKKLAESRLGRPVTRAVITVPPSFDEMQRRSISQSATIAGFWSVDLVNETVAVAVAHADEVAKRGLTSVGRCSLVFHHGSGSTNVMVARMEKRTVEILSYAGISNLGGFDFDERMKTVLIQKQEKGGHKNEPSVPRNNLELQNMCETVKEWLSKHNSAQLGPKVSINRKEYEKESAFLLLCIERLISIALLQAQLDHRKISDVIVVGGPARLLKLLPKFSSKFPWLFDHGGTKYVNEDDAAATGAAIMAQKLNGWNHKEDGITVYDIVSDRQRTFLGRNEEEFRNFFQNLQKEDLEMAQETKIQFPLEVATSKSDFSLYLKPTQLELMVKRSEEHDRRDLESQDLDQASDAATRAILTLERILTHREIRSQCEEAKKLAMNRITKMDQVREILKVLKDVAADTRQMNESLEEARKLTEGPRNGNSTTQSTRSNEKDSNRSASVCRQGNTGQTKRGGGRGTNAQHRR